MGFMGLGSYGESDNASDFAYVVNIDALKSFVKKAKKELKDTANEFNTPGWLNVILYVEAFILPVLDDLAHYDEFQPVVEMVKKLQERLDGVIAANEKEPLYSSDLMEDFSRMKKNLAKVIASGYN